ncbi:MAG TPA: ATP-binding protein, partial [Polyangia bacterium]|nr:ATP-binding protein [Polyangia bacterium]
EDEICQRTDRMFLWLLLLQWLAEVLIALWASPRLWDGSLTAIPPLVWKAFLLGGAITSLPVYVAFKYPGTSLTRQEIAIGQGLATSLMVHLSGGLFEMKYAVFASLAFLAMYRDARVLVLATLVTSLDHMIGCFVWPRSVYGLAAVGSWAWVEHVGFVVVEDLLLFLALRKSQEDMLGTARKQALIDASRLALEREVAERQRTERLLSLQYIITRLLAASDSLAAAAPKLLKIVGENQGWHVGELWEVEESERRIRCVDIWHADQYGSRDYLTVRRTMQLGREGGLPGRVWHGHLPLWVADLKAEPDLSASLGAAANLRGAFAIPLRNGANVIGVMAFYSQEARQPNDDQLSMINALGGQIGQFMERKRIEQGLRESEERYRSVVAALDEGIILIDHQGNLLAANASAERILDRPADQMIGQSCLEPFAGTVDEDGQPVSGDDLPFMTTLRSGEPRSNVILGVDRSGGGQVWISVNAQPLVYFGEQAPRVAVASFNDITGRKAAEGSLRAAHAQLESRVQKRTSQLTDANLQLQSEIEERERAQRELRTAKESADTANQAKSAFLANMSHELRTPLNAVIGFSELLEQEIFGELNVKQRAYVGNVLISGRHLLQLVNDILDISKVEAGRMDLTYELTPVGSLVDIVHGVIHAVAAKKGIELEVSVPPNLPDLYVDPGRIKQVLYNLIANAIKFTPRGGKVCVSAHADGDHVSVLVSDTGIGIAPENIPRLFREFEQLPQLGGARPEGTGLGLALTKRLVELHGGAVQVESQLGRGSTFSVRLPRRQRDDSGIFRQSA